MTLQTSQALACYPSPANPIQFNFTYSSLPVPQPSIWVKLLQPLTAFSFDEAWLLCQHSETEWLAWVPDYGEILLRIDQFAV
ncbi:MAG: hypothetical protein MUF49_25140 [Oculatellaceae cyanobacterium Prado106]|jgi:hypothetical protein|nr:hypothetical protein [Oculatellaceae cyanobacterium Prado106]